MKSKQNGSAAVAAVVVLAVVMCVGGTLGGLAFGIPEFSRYQTRAYAENQVQVNNIRIQQTKQLVEVETQNAQVRIAEAGGIAKAQEIINASLTDRYLQHEAIKAQMAMAGSPSHTQIYIPVGNNGIPIVHTTEVNK